jgi:hypothetical protein
MRDKFYSENTKGGDHSEKTGIGMRIILEWMLGKSGGKVCNGFIWLRIKAVVNTAMNLRVP